MSNSRTIIDVVRLSTGFLAQRGCETPRLDAELLAAHSLGLRRLDLYLQHDRPLTEAELAPIRELLRRRAAGEPVAYLTGEREFSGRAFTVRRGVLVPRPETETLVERTLVWARSVAGPRGDGLRLADAGTGSGCIAVTLAAELPGAEVVACDVSAEATAVARENAARHGVVDRVRVVEGSWLESLVELRPLDALVSNPPYVLTSDLDTLMRDVRDFEPREALDGGVDGLDAYRTLLSLPDGLLAASGWFGVEVDPRRAATVAELVTSRFPGAGVSVVRDLAGLDRVVEATLAQQGEAQFADPPEPESERRSWSSVRWAAASRRLRRS